MKFSKYYVNRLIAYLVSLFLRPSATSDPINFKIWEKKGYQIIPMSFYSPIPNTGELERSYPAPKPALLIDYQISTQLRFLQEVFPKFSTEYNSFPLRSSKMNYFYYENDAFTGIDPIAYYCMIRYFQPKTIIEIGSGHSTLLGYQALKKTTNNFILTVIDPWPRNFARNFLSSGFVGIEHIPQKVETVGKDLFKSLQKNDILFIDGSHVVRTGGDVCFLILEILPLLQDGVIVHFHDIFLPNDYPKEWVVNKHIFYSEQYLLQAYLIENPYIEILFTSHFLCERFPDLVKAICPSGLGAGGGSFWIRKVK